MVIIERQNELLLVNIYIPQPTLSELIPGQYVSITARIAYVKTSERTDSLGTKLVFTGVLEDSTFKVSFVSHL